MAAEIIYHGRDHFGTEEAGPKQFRFNSNLTARSRMSMSVDPIVGRVVDAHLSGGGAGCGGEIVSEWAHPICSSAASEMII
jgi:hypothetical protein